MAFEFEKLAAVTVSSKEWVEKLRPHEVAEFATAVAERFDQKFADRNDIAEQFSAGLSEQGARFLAEVVTHFYQRQRQ